MTGENGDLETHTHIQTHARRHLMNKRGRFINAEIHFTRRNSVTKDKIFEQTKQNSNSLNRLNLERMRIPATLHIQIVKCMEALYCRLIHLN